MWAAFLGRILRMRMMRKTMTWLLRVEAQFFPRGVMDSIWVRLERPHIGELSPNGLFSAMMSWQVPNEPWEFPIAGLDWTERNKYCRDSKMLTKWPSFTNRRYSVMVLPYFDCGKIWQTGRAWKWVRHGLPKMEAITRCEKMMTDGASSCSSCHELLIMEIFRLKGPQGD